MKTANFPWVRIKCPYNRDSWISATATIHYSYSKEHRWELEGETPTFTITNDRYDNKGVARGRFRTVTGWSNWEFV